VEIVKLKVSQLKAYEKNAKKHTQEQIEHIVNSIKRFQFCDPIGVWGEKNIVVEGHGRLLALKKMGVKEVDCIRLDHLTDEERKAYTLVHNQSTLETPIELDLLSEELSSITEIDMTELGFADVSGTEFTEEQLNQFFEDAPAKEKDPKKIQCPHCGEWFEV
jgi:site-specific DNA-methyltransferase (adenine-specific)